MVEEYNFIIERKQKPIFAGHRSLNKNTYWTKQAIQCYNRNCKCEGCYIYKVCECECFMKNTVIELIKRYGIPQPTKEKELF